MHSSQKQPADVYEFVKSKKIHQSQTIPVAAIPIG